MNHFRALAMMGLGLILGVQANAVSYTVPTTDPQLSPYANFEISDLQVVRENRRIQISYSLPLELTGEKVTLVLTGENEKSGSLRLRGEMGRAECHGARCEVDYRHLPISREAVISRITEISQSPEEFNARLQLAMDFEGNPIGIVNLDSPLMTIPGHSAQ